MTEDYSENHQGDVLARQMVDLRKQSRAFDPQVIGSRFHIWKQDPMAADIGRRVVYIPEDISTGPSDGQISIKELPPVFQTHEQDFLFDEDEAEALDAAHTFAVVRMTLTFYQRQLGAAVPWQWNSDGGDDPLEVAPHGGAGANAFYSRADKELRFFHFHSDALDKTVFTCRSLDIVAHETGHAILDAIQPQWIFSNQPPQTGGLHEAFGDLTSIFLILSQLDMAEYVVAETKADLHQGGKLAALAEEFGAAALRPSTGRPPGLRNALNQLKLSDVSNQVHDISQVFTGAVFGVLADTFTARRRPSQQDDAKTLHETGMYLAGVVLQAIKQAPASGATYKHVAEQMIAIAGTNGDDELKQFIEFHFTQREVLGANSFDFPDVPQVRLGRCGTMQHASYRKFH